VEKTSSGPMEIDKVGHAGATCYLPNFFVGENSAEEGKFKWKEFEGVASRHHVSGRYIRVAPCLERTRAETDKKGNWTGEEKTLKPSTGKGGLKLLDPVRKKRKKGGGKGSWVDSK